MRLPRRKLLLASPGLLLPATPRVHAANTIAWNSSDKSADISLATNAYYGTNSGMYNPATAGWRSVRSTWNAGSGKHFFQVIVTRKEGNSGSAIVGVSDSSATLASYCGSDSHGLGFQANNTYQGGSNLGANAGRWTDYGTNVINLCIDRDNNRVKMQSMILQGNNGLSSTWYDGAGSSGDPTNTSFGTSISGFSGNVYVMASSFFQSANSGFDNPYILINGGGWPFIPGTTVPSGYTPPDAAYPFTIPAGAHSFTTIGTSCTAYNNNMRIQATGQGALGTWRNNTTNAVLPAGCKAMFEVEWDNSRAQNNTTSYSQMVGVTLAVGASASIIWTGTGAVGADPDGTWDYFRGGDVCAVVVRRDVNRMWGKVISPHSSGYWNKNVSADPAANVGGKDISGISTDLYAPGIQLFSESTVTGTMNLGAMTFAQTLPSGIVSVEDSFNSSARRSRGIILP